MAITRIHAIKATVSGAVNYICNEKKTDSSLLISSFGTTPETSANDFKFTLSHTDSSDPNKAFHLIQSFAPGEVSAEEAHKIGEELADRLLKGRYSYIVATHTDKGHIHNHILFCAADNIDYKKYHDCKRTYWDIRHLNDELCEEHNLSVIQISETSSIAEKCKVEGVTVNDYLLAKLFTEGGTKRIVIAKDIRKSLKCYNPGAMGNYSTAFSVELGSFGDDIFTVAKQVHEKVRMITNKPSSLYLVLQCYAALDPGLLDAAMMASRGRFESKAAEFIGKNFFHLDKAEGYSITNLGKAESDTIEDAYFIPPASPAIKKTLGVLTLNGKMRICTSER